MASVRTDVPSTHGRDCRVLYPEKSTERIEVLWPELKMKTASEKGGVRNPRSSYAPERPPAALKLWAVVIVNKRSQWIHWETLAITRAQAWTKYSGRLPEGYRESAEWDRRLGRVRFAKVRVEEIKPEPKASSTSTSTSTSTNRGAR